MKIQVPISILCIAFFACMVAADPQGVSLINRGLSERATDASSIGQVSEAGNVTSLDINGGSLTQRWQGYFGNVSGTITLEDAAGNSLYDWSSLNPIGEVYAANDSVVTWSSIYCVNFSADTTLERYDADRLNRFIGYTSSDDLAKQDTVNGTFNHTLGDQGETLTVGTTTFNNADNCSMIYLHGSSGYQTSNFREVLLTDNVSIVFASILEQDVTGFNGVSADFEMIVAVNGTVQYNPINYFFFAELS